MEAFKQHALDIAPAARAVCMAQAFAELERERVDAYIRPIFDRYTFTNKRTGERITDPQWLYLSEEEDLIANYFEDCDRAHREHGFKGPRGHCPALTAEHLLMVTQSALIDIGGEPFGIVSTDVYGENRKKLLDILLGAALKAEAEHTR